MLCPYAVLCPCAVLQVHWRNIVQRLRDVFAASSHLAADGGAAGEGAGAAAERAMNSVLDEHVRLIISDMVSNEYCKVVSLI